MNSVYTLDEITFIAGETQDFYFPLKTYLGKDLSAEGLTMNFSVVEYTNKFGTPVLSTTGTVVTRLETSSVPMFKVTLEAQETVNLYGKYIYQTAVKDENSNVVDIPAQGIMFINNNINKSFIN